MQDSAAVQCSGSGTLFSVRFVRALGDVYAVNTNIVDDGHPAYVNLTRSSPATRPRRNLRALFTCRRKFQTVVASFDKTYYQTTKGMVTSMDILAPGGALIIASACSEGFGSKEFRDA